MNSISFCPILQEQTIQLSYIYPVSEKVYPLLEKVVIRLAFIADNRNHMKLGGKLTQLCKAQGISLSKLAKDANVPVQTVHAWTTGRRSINPDQLRKVALTLKVSIHQLMFDEPDPFESLSEEVLKEIFSGDIRVTLHKIEKKKR